MLFDINDILKTAVHKPVIAKAITLQRRIRLHAEPDTFMQYEGAIALTEFLNWVEKLLPLDKFSVFKQLLRAPLPTAELVDKISRELRLVFSSRNASESYQFSDTALLTDWLNYKKTVLNEPTIWQSEGWKQFMLSPNSVLIVDLPKKQSSQLPEPYFYWLQIDRVVDYRTPDGTHFDWIAFRQADNVLVVIDAEAYYTYIIENEKAILADKAEHSLGYCPARFFLTESMTTAQKDLKINPLVKALSDLDWYLFFAISKRHLDSYAAYPIYSAYQADCDFKNEETGEYCDGGFLRNAEDNYIMQNDGTLKRCPKCGQRKLAGPGSFIELPIPNQVEGIADLRNPVQITTIDRDSLDYSVKEVSRLENKIFVDVVGSDVDNDVQGKEAINEAQIAANHKSRTAVLNDIKGEFEAAEKFVNDTICRLRYGKGFTSSSISLGTEFYIHTSAELYKRYNLAKSAGVSASELSVISSQIFEVEHGNNPDTLRRIQLLKQLEPYQHKTIDELIRLHDVGMLNKADLELKLNFDAYIDKFERENGNILQYMANSSIAARIEAIRKKLISYINTEDNGKVHDGDA